MELMDAIYRRRAIRSFTDRRVEKATVEILIKAAVQAPSAINQQPWAFAVIQDRTLLAAWSDQVKVHLLKVLAPESPLYQHRDMLTNPGFNVFYDAGTLLIIFAKSQALNGDEDCCLAAQNLMLAAYGMGLDTCPIGFARPWLNLPEVSRQLGIPSTYHAVFPVIVGYSRGEAAPVTRRDPDILFWK